MVAQESRAITLSIPVPTIGASGLSSGTACLCILDPISARFASSCSKNGMSEAATPTSIRALKSISSTSSVLRKEISPP